MKTRWELEHERLMDKMCGLLKLPKGATNLQIQQALADADDATKDIFAVLDKANDKAVAKAEKQL